MRLWNGGVMYAPRAPDYYALPDTENCIFRLMHKHGDVQAWNLYWLTQPQVDLIPLQRSRWREVFQSLSGTQTRAFYEALDTPVLNRLTLGGLLSRPPREALRLLEQADLSLTQFYHLAGGEAWRERLLGRLFLAERIDSLYDTNAPRAAGVVIEADFIHHRYTRPEPESDAFKRPA